MTSSLPTPTIVKAKPATITNHESDDQRRPLKTSNTTPTASSIRLTTFDNNKRFKNTKLTPTASGKPKAKGSHRVAGAMSTTPGMKSSHSSGGNSNGSRENTGRWTKAEHDRFVKGLDMYGKEWKKIAAMIETRTIVQIRTHAQKYFQKIAKTKFEQLGKQVPTDLMSTASNTSKLKHHKGTGSPLTLSEALSVAADVPFGTKSASSSLKTTAMKEKSRMYAKTVRDYPTAGTVKPKGKLKENCNKIGNIPSTTSNNRVRKANEPRSGLDSKIMRPVKMSKVIKNTNMLKNEQQKLTISTADNLSLVRKKNDEEDLKWLVNTMPGGSCYNEKDAYPEASPTGVGDFRLYRTFGSSSSSCSYSENLEAGATNEEQDILTMYDSVFDDTIESTDAEDMNMSLIACACDSDVNAEGEHRSMETEESLVKTISDWINSSDPDCTLDSFCQSTSC